MRELDRGSREIRGQSRMLDRSDYQELFSDQEITFMYFKRPPWISTGEYEMNESLPYVATFIIGARQTMLYVMKMSKASFMSSCK